MHWLCFQTNSREEFLAKSCLNENGFKVILPYYLRKISHARKIQKKPYPIFPNYGFLYYDGNPSNLLKINRTRGVRNYLSKLNGLPQVVPNKITKSINELKQVDGTYKFNKDYLKKGDEIYIVEGALSGIKGILKEYIDDKRALLLVNLLGRMNLVNFDIGMVEKA